MENKTEVPGTMSHRGGIIDIFPSTSDTPFRLEFFGDSIDSIRTFDPATQRSVEKLSSFAVGPAVELLAPRRIDKQSLADILNGVDLSGCTAEVKQQFARDKEMLLSGQLLREAQFYSPFFNQGKILDYLLPDTLIVMDEPSAIAQAASVFEEESAQIRSEKLERGELPRNFPVPHLNWDELEPVINSRQTLSLEAWGIEDGLDFISAPGYAGKLPSFITKTVELLGQQKRIVIVSHQANRLSELFAENNIIAAPVEEVAQAPGPGMMVLGHGSLPEGWVMGGDPYLFTDAEIFGFIKQRRLVKKRPAARHKITLDFVPDDYVVHVEHGIGKFTSVIMLNTAGSDKEYLVLQYAGNDILYVPTEIGRASC